MARLFVSFVHEDEKLALIVQELLQTELNLREEVFLSSDKAQIYAGDFWLQKIKGEFRLLSGCKDLRGGRRTTDSGVRAGN